MVCVLHEKLKLTCIYIKYVLFIVRKLRNYVYFCVACFYKETTEVLGTWEQDTLQ